MQQNADFSCGIACAHMILEYYGLKGAAPGDDFGSQLESRLSHPWPCTHPDLMIETLRTAGLAVAAGERGTLEMVYDSIDEGCPVLVLDSTLGGRWRLVIGYDSSGDAGDYYEGGLLIADPWHDVDPSAPENGPGITIQGARAFHDGWHEDRLFDRRWERFYIVAHPHGFPYS